jgi:TatD DNase family protein
MKLIDTHTHLYVNEFDDDLDATIARALENGVEKMFFPAIDSSTHDAMLAVEAKYKNNCFSMIGLHPCSVNQNFLNEINIIKQWLQKRKFIAIGEVGLDLHWDKTFYTQQLQAFEIQMQLALDYKIPIVIHTRSAMQSTIEAVKPFANKGLKGIFHCFGDSIDVANQIIDLGFLLGIGGVVTYKKSGLDITLKNVDVKHLVLETDAPYLSPVPYRGKRNESAYIKIVAQKIADIKDISIEEVAKITSLNANTIFQM